MPGQHSMTGYPYGPSWRCWAVVGKGATWSGLQIRKPPLCLETALQKTDPGVGDLLAGGLAECFGDQSLKGC